MENRIFFQRKYKKCDFLNFWNFKCGFKMVLDDLQACLGYEKISTESGESKNGKTKYLRCSETCLKFDQILVKNRNFWKFWKTFFKFWQFYKRLCKIRKNNPDFQKLQIISYLLVVFIFFVAQKTKKYEGGLGGG